MKIKILPFPPFLMGHKVIALFISGFFVLGALKASAQRSSMFTSNGKDIKIEQFNDKILHLMDSIGVPGASLSIIENNKVVYSQTYGYKNSTEKIQADSNTVFEACSLSKTYLVYVTYILSDEGRIDLNKPIYQYLENDRLTHDPRYKLITPLMILQHTSGIENWQEDNNKEILEIIEEPGKKFNYSGEGFEYLASVISRILDEPYETYMKKMVLNPLNLKHTLLHFDSIDSNTNFTYGHNLFGMRNEKWISAVPSPASSVHTTSNEYAKFLISFFDKTQFSGHRVKQMLKTKEKIYSDSHGEYYISNGLFTIKSAKDIIVNFSGSNTGFKADMLYSVRNKRGYILFTNSELGIMLSPEVNKLTTQLPADVWFNNIEFKNLAFLDNLTIAYRKLGKDQFLEVIGNSAKDSSYFEPEIFEYFVSRLMRSDKATAGNVAEVLNRTKENWPYILYVLGVTEDEIHQNYTKALKYFKIAKSLKYTSGNIDSYIARCEKKLLASKE